MNGDIQSEQRRERFWWGIAVAIILLASFGLKLRHLGHPALTYWDESFHAIVAQHLAIHPLTPTLVEHPYLPDKGWIRGHIWLHKPVLPLWTIALSFRLLGTTALALRLPSAILATLAAGLTYLIGCQWLNRRSAFIAMALQAFCPVILLEVHGYMFADHVDISLLFWVELSVYILARAIGDPSHSYRLFILCGIAQGLAYLSKSLPGGLVTTLLIGALLAKQLRFVPAPNINLKRVAVLLMSTAMTVAPWTIWCALRFPVDFHRETMYVLRHVSAELEGWSGPWHITAYTYTHFILGIFYIPVLAAGVALLRRLIKRRETGLSLVYTWAVCGWLPFLFTATKTPTAALLSLPALLLLVGTLASEAIDHRGGMLAIAFGLVCAGVFLPIHSVYRYGLTPNPVDLIQLPEGKRVVEQIVATVTIASGAYFLLLLFRAKSARLSFALLCLTGLAGSFLAIQWLLASYAVTAVNRRAPAFADIAHFADTHLPANAVLLFDEQYRGEAQSTMFHSTRTCYSISDHLLRNLAKNSDDLAAKVRAAGGMPVLVSYRILPLKVLYRSDKDQRTIYEWPATMPF